MAATSRAEANWEGDLAKGGGHVRPASGAFGELAVTWAARSERPAGIKETSPEELLAAAHAGCFSMALANELSKAGHRVERLDTTAEIDFVPGQGITAIRLGVRAKVSGLDGAGFQKLAEAAKEGCPVSKLFHGNAQISLDAHLV
jgi:osmotically inducible protein OsmC